MSTALGLLAVATLIGLNAGFVAAEFALVTVDRTRLSQRAEAGSRPAARALALLGHLSHHLSGAQLGITVTSLMLGFVAEPTVARVLEPALEPLLGDGNDAVAVALALGLVTLGQMVLGELVPKTVAIARPLPTSVALARPLQIYDLAFGWLISSLDHAANATVRRLGVEPAQELSSVRSLPELALLFQASADEGLLDFGSSGLLRRSVRFADKAAADALVPRTAMVTVSLDAAATALVELSRSTGRSRFPVTGRDIDDIRGIVHVKAVLGVPPAERGTTGVANLMGPVLAVPETRLLEDLLVDLRASRSHMAIVVDEYGGTAGLVTLEDVLEEIVGEIADEYDLGEGALTPSPGRDQWVLPGTLHTDEVFDLCGFEMPEGPYETLAGFLLARLGRLPEEPGDTVRSGGWVLEVVEVEGLRVTKVRLRPSEP